MRRPIRRALPVLLVLSAVFAPVHAQAQPVATATVTPPASPLIGDPLVFPVSFDNTGSTTGYGPFIDLILPATGADGAGAATDDGITFVSATYLGVPVTAVTMTFDAGGNATHPYAKTAAGAAVVVTGTPGDQLVVLQLPFGSFTAPQPAATVQVTTTLSPLADAGTALNIRARGGFQYGADPLDNPPSDPSLLGAFTANQPVSPAVWRMTKTYIGPEDETATGPNFPRQYRIDVDIANGQTVTSLDLTDVLPASMQYVAVVSTLINNAPAAATAVATPSTTVPGGTLTRRFASVTGTAGTQDASLIFSYYVPRVAAAGAVIIDPVTGDDATSVNDARSQGNWTPIDGRDTPTLLVNDVTANDHTLTPKSIAIQKGVTIAVDTGGAGPTPGDTLEYTLQIQVSDYFAMQDLVVTDVISDGQRRDAGFTPTLAISEHSGGASAAAGMAGANTTFVVSGATGETTATFQIGAEQTTRGLDTRLIGGCVPASGTGGPAPDCTAFNGGGTTVTVVYRTIIQDSFSNTYPSGDQSVDHGDRLTNTVNAQANLLSVANVTTLTGSNEADGSAAGVTILAGTLTKSIYAINGNTSFGTARLGPGDTVTYRLRYTLPSSDLEPVTITDFLPLPVLFATEMAGPFNATVSAAVPAAGTAKFGPADTFFALSGRVPTISVDAAGNAVEFDYLAFDDPANTPTTIDILFTVTASNQPFADGLFLTNQARVQEGSTNAGNSIVDAIIQILLNEPNVVITKGVVTSNNTADVYAPTTVGPVSFSAPGTAGYRGSGTITSNGLTATPINSNVSRLDAGDTVTFAIVLENTGSGPEGAFDVTVKDTIPAGFVAPANLAALNLSVTSGAGTPIAFTDLGGGAFGSGGGLFGNGLRLTDPSASQGALTTYGATTGTNVAVITYDLVLAASVGANQALTNTATLANFAGTDGGPDFTTVDRTDTAVVTTAPPTATKTILSTNHSHTTGNTVAIGEQVQYRVTLTVPEGTTPAAVLTDVLDSGLAVVSLDNITASAGLTAANGAFNAILAAATIGPEPPGSPTAADQGRRVSLDFGSLTNTDTNNAAAETIQLDYTVVVLNSTGNNRGVGRNNAAGLTYTGGSVSASAPNVTIAEPTLQVVKSAVPTGGDAGDPVTFTITLSHTAASNTTAFDVALSDVLPAGLTFVSAAFSSGTNPTTLNTTGGVAATWTSFALGDTSTFQINATIDTGLASGTVLTNTASTTYTSLPATVTTAQSPYNTLSTERTGNPGDPGGVENDYVASGSAAVTVSNAAVTKAVVSTNQAHTTGNDVAIGEILTYTVTVSVPEAVSNGVTLVDTLDPGLAFVGFDSLVVSNPAAVTSSVGGGFPAVLSGATVSNPGGAAPLTAGSRVSFNFGTITNTDTNSAIAETLTLTYRAVVLNAATNVRGQLRNNSAVWTANGSSVTASAPDVILVEPSLVVDKTASPIRGDANDAITFTIAVAHAGASNTAAFDAVITDVIPAGLTITSGPTASGGLAPTTLTLSAGTITATWSSFALGATSTITFTATLDPSIVPGTVTTNTAALAWTSLPGAVGVQTGNNTLSAERTGNLADPGGAANTYSVSDPATVTLNSNSLAGTVYVDQNNDGLLTVGETGITGVIVTLTGTDHLGNAVALTTVTGAGGTYQFTGLRPGTYTVRETQPVAYADGLDSAGSLAGTVGNDIVSAIAVPLGGPTNAVNYNFGERPTADLQITKTDSPDPVVPGTPLTYTLVVRNNGPSVASNVTVRDPLPTGTAFASIAAPGLVCTTPAVGAAGDVVCTTPSLAVGASTTITLVAQTSPTLVDGAVITNAAAVRSDTVDLVPANNTDTEPTTVAVGTSADLSIAKTDLADPVVTGATITYTLTVRNNGPANATNVVASDILPAGLTLVSATPSQGAPCTGAATISCALGALANGAQATITIVASTSSAGVVVNAATVTGSEPDPTPINNLATEPTTVAAPGSADLRIAKDDSPDPTVANGIVAYTLTVTNRGPAAASTVTVTDTVPANTTFEAITAPVGWTCTTPAYGGTGVVSCANTTLAVSATATFVLHVRVAAGTPAGTSLSNTASVGAATPDPDSGNNTDTEPTLVAGAASADLGIVKTDAPDPQVAGSAVSYTLTVTNYGPATATNVTVVDTLPSGTTFLSGSSGCSSGGATVTCAIGTLAAGASTAVGLTISTPPVPGLISNSATVSATEPDPVPGNNTEGEDTTLVQRADVQIVKTGPGSATPGSTVVYTLTVTNNGPSVADTVTVNDATPTGLTFVSNAGACTTAFPCLLGTMLPGEVRTITTTFRVPAGYTTPNPIVNTATVSTTTAGDNPSNNSSTVSTPLAFAGDVAVVKTASTMSPGVGASFDYVITVTNLGPSDVTNAVITEALPGGVTYQGHVASSGAYVTGSGLWTIPALAAAGGSATLTITVRADVAGPLPNTATKTAQDQPDPNPANDSSTVTPVALNLTDVSIVKIGPATVLAGGTIAYTLTVTNNGPAVAIGVSVADPTPANLTFVSNAGACATAFPCALGALAVGDVRVITATYTVGSVANGTVVTNVATVTSTTPDSNPANNTSSVPTTVDTRADVGVTKTVAPAQVQPGQTVTYTMTAMNNGPNPATAVVATDQLPAGLGYVSSTPSQGAYDPVSGRWTIGSLAVGQTVSLAITATVDVSGPITNIIVRTSQNEPDSDPSNDSAVAVVNGTPYADIAVRKSASPSAPAVGTPVTFTVVVTNRGPFAAPAVTVDDALPAGVALVSATPTVGAYVPATGRWTIGPMSVGASATLTVVATVQQPGPIVNRAVVSGVGVTDPNPANDQDSVVVNGGIATNLRLSKVALRPVVGVFEFAEFLITVTNDGPSPATGVVVTDQLPSGLTYQAAQTSQGAYDPSTGLWTVGALAATQSATLQLTAVVGTAGTIVNTARISASNEPDPDPSDDVDTAPIVTPLPTAAQCADVELTQQFSPAVAPGGTLRYVYTATNRGPGYASDVMISGMVPAGTTVTAMNPSAGGSCAIVNGEVHCTWPGPTLIGAGAARSVEILQQVAPSTPPGSIVWGWFMSMTSNTDCNHANDAVDSYVFVGGGGVQADLQLQAAVQDAAGTLATSRAARTTDVVTLRLAVTNHGTVPADGSYALIASEAGAFTVIGATSTAGTFGVSGPSSGVWTTGPIAPGTTVFADIQVQPVITTAFKLLVMRTLGAPIDPDATNDWTELTVDGVGSAPNSGRWVAAGNVDGAAGGEIVTGNGEGERPQVRVYNGSGADTGVRFNAFEPAFRGGVRLATCDIDHDGIDEIVAGQGPGGSAVKVFRLVGGTVAEVTGFLPFEPNFAGGVSVSCADLDGDNRADVIVGAGAGRAPEVRVFSVSSAGPIGIGSWMAYEPAFTGGVRVTTGRYSGGVVAPFQVLTMPGSGRAGELRLWSIGGGSATVVGAADVLGGFTGGAWLDAGDVDGDGGLDIAILPEAGAASVLKIFSMSTLSWIVDVPAGSAGAGGLRLDIGTVSGGPGRPELVTGQGPGGLPQVRVFQLGPGGVVLRVDVQALETP